MAEEATVSRPRLLLIKQIVPYPPDQGTKVVTFDLIRALRDAFDVTVLARALDDADHRAARDLEEWCERVVAVTPANKRSIVHRAAFKVWYGLVSLATRRSLKSLYDCPGTLVGAARKLSRENFDVVLVEYWQLYPLLDLFPPERVVLLTHDVDLLVNRQSALLEKRLIEKVRKVRRWMLEQREEVRTYQRVGRILTLTERDAHAVRKLARDRAQVSVLPFGLDPERFAPPAGNTRRREVLFMGALHASFNADALDQFARSILPRLDDIAGLEVTIVGGELPRHLSFLAADDRVNVVGHVEDVRPYLHRAACIVIPLRFGGGLRIRTLEAMMAGLPVVCSSVAMAGMDFEPGRDYLLADSPEDAAAAVSRLLNDPELATSLSRSARTRVAQLHGRAAAPAARSLFESFVRQ